MVMKPERGQPEVNKDFPAAPDAVDMKTHVVVHHAVNYRVVLT